MGKFKAAGGAAAAEIEAEVGYSSYDEASYGVPPKGPYRCRLRRLEATETKENEAEPEKGGRPMLRGMLVIDEPKGTKKAKYNGYIMNVYRVATEDQAGRMNQFLTALAGGPGAKAKALIKAFWTVGAVTDDDDMIIKIGTMKFDPKGDGIPIGVNTRNDSYNDEKRIAPASFMAIGDMPAPVAADDEDEEDESEEETADEAEESEEADEEVEERREELAEMTLAALKKEAKSAGFKLADYKDLDQDGLIELIIDHEFPIDEEDEEDEEEETEEDEAEGDEARDEREEELEGLSLAKLKAEAKKAGLKLADYKGMEEDALRELILDTEFPATEAEDEGEEDEGEEGEDERAAREEELSELKLPALKTIAKGLGMKLAEYRGLDEEELVAAILALEFPADEEEDEDEEEPPAKPAARKGRASAAAKPAATTSKAVRRGGKKAADDEPPF